jgi:hypothetical protein
MRVLRFVRTGAVLCRRPLLVALDTSQLCYPELEPAKGHDRDNRRFIWVGVSMPNTTRRRTAPESPRAARAALELLFAAGAAVAGVAGIAYFLFAPRLAIGTASSPCVLHASDSPTLPVCDTSPPSTIVHQTLVETSFSLGWAAYFTVLAVLMVGIPVMTILYIRTRAPLWRWALIVVAVLVLLGSAPVNDSLSFYSLGGIAQGGRSLLPGVVLGLITAIMVFFDGRMPSATPNNELAAQG